MREFASVSVSAVCAVAIGVGASIMFTRRPPALSPAPAPKFAIGDCFHYVDNDKEAWDQKDYRIYKVLEIGKKHYRVSAFIEGSYDDHLESEPFFYDDLNQKVTCPEAKT